MSMLIIIGILASISILRAIFTLATWALPVYAALAVTFGLHSFALGLPSAAMIGLLCGWSIIALGRHLMFAHRLAHARMILGVLFAAPSAVAGVQIVRALTDMGSLNAAVSWISGLLGAVLVAHASWRKMMIQEQI